MKIEPRWLLDGEPLGSDQIGDDPDLATDSGTDDFDWRYVPEEKCKRLQRKHELMDAVTASVDVDLPGEVWEVAREEAGDDLASQLLDYVLFEYRFLVDGVEVHRRDGYDGE